MTLKIDYTHICDTCCDHFDRESHVLRHGMVIPQPKAQYVINGHTLCPKCVELAVPALNEALLPRLKTE